MKALKIICLLVLTISFAQCKTVKLVQNPPFTITGATYNNWVGGQPGIKGTNLVIAIENKLNTTIKSIYFRNKKNTVSIENRKGKEYLVVNINTSSVIVGVKKDIVKAKGVKTTKTTPLKVNSPTIPFKLDTNQAVIKFMVGKKTFYYKVSNIKKTETVFYP
jgi:hypothetical protein